jgi:hypothetical protein
MRLSKINQTSSSLINFLGNIITSRSLILKHHNNICNNKNNEIWIGNLGTRTEPVDEIANS